MSAATVVRGTGKPAPSYLGGYAACTRCGLVRRTDRRWGAFCVDCRRFALADGWVTK